MGNTAFSQREANSSEQQTGCGKVPAVPAHIVNSGK